MQCLVSKCNRSTLILKLLTLLSNNCGDLNFIKFDLEKFLSSPEENDTTYIMLKLIPDFA